MGLGQVVAAALHVTTTTVAIVMTMSTFAIAALQQQLCSSSLALVAAPLTARMRRREVDSWSHHGPGDVIRVTVLRQPFDDAEYDDQTAAFVSFEDLLSAADASVETDGAVHSPAPLCMTPLNRRVVQSTPSPALLHHGSCAPDAGQLPTHVDRKDLGHLTNEYLFQGTTALWFSSRRGAAPLYDLLCAGPLSVYARLYQAGDAVAMASTPRLFLQPAFGIKTARTGTARAAPADEAGATAGAAAASRNVAAAAPAGKCPQPLFLFLLPFSAVFHGSPCSRADSVQRDFSSAKIKRGEMASMMGEEMRCCGAIRAFVKEIDDVMHKAIRCGRQREVVSQRRVTFGSAGVFEPSWADPVFRYGWLGCGGGALGCAC